MSDAPPPRVLLVEDNAVYRSTLELLLPAEGLEVVGAAGDVRSALALVAESRPDVVLLDLRLPGLEGEDAVEALQVAAPEVRIVCLTADMTPELVDAVLDAGAEVVLDKARPTREIADALRSGSQR